MSKSVDAFRTISEVADDLEIPKHVLRFWEVKFAQIRPMKRGGGRRYYRPEDLELLRGIRHLLHREGYTIKGVQKILREQGVEAVKVHGSGREAVPDQQAGAVTRVTSAVPGAQPAMPRVPLQPSQASVGSKEARPMAKTGRGEATSPELSKVRLGRAPAAVSVPAAATVQPRGSARRERLQVAILELERCRELLTSDPNVVATPLIAPQRSGSRR